MELVTTNTEFGSYIEFSLGKENYAIPLLMVQEVIPPMSLTKIPQSPSYFLGMINLRGQVIPIIDLRLKLKISPKDNREDTVIIININSMSVGICVDSVNTVLNIAKENIADVPEIEGQINSQMTLGVYKKEKSLTVLLDMQKVIGKDDISRHL